jgi:DNA (cytosine-5)-methyltransferase 1
VTATPVNERLTVVDVFSGVGGLSLGFESAGCEIVAAFDSNEHHVSAFKSGHLSKCVAMAADIREISARDVIGKTNLPSRELDVLVGGPPCQPFSTAGKRQGLGDERGNLVWEFVRLVRDLKPRAFVMENVLGLRSIHGGDLFRNLICELLSFSYECDHFVLDAADFGVPQNRRRLFIVGKREGGARFASPPPTHRSERNTTLLNRHLPLHRTVRDAIWDLRGSRFHKRSSFVDDEALVGYEVGKPSEYQKLMRGTETAVSGNGVTAHFPHTLANISTGVLPQGAVEPSTRYRRLFWDRPAFTLRAGSGTFTALRPIHPSQARVITIREAARLQSFPDRVQFSSTKKWAYQQIGNSVPPLLAEAVASVVIRALNTPRARAV